MHGGTGYRLASLRVDRFMVYVRYTMAACPLLSGTTPAGFTAILDDPDYVAFRNAHVARNDSSAEKRNACPRYYPQSVSCTRTVYSTVTTTTTITNAAVTVTLPPTTTITETATTTTTITDTVVATATTTDTSTQTDSTTTVTTAFTTLTVMTTIYTSTTTTTSYAACASNNILTLANGGNGVDVIALGNFYPPDMVFNTAYDCCVYCLTTDLTSQGGFVSGNVFNGGSCICLLQSTCDPGNYMRGDKYFTDPSLHNNPVDIVGNGPCGSVANGGNFD
ncbi:hypothetical protein GGR57DRAFT_505296 [Xylariaceae sp. FL1272]|nr:hypothetical protein GGR57DRAFT_505296 [Xylariaceae sp. FL1272]